jgi:hypothetical protein
MSDRAESAVTRLLRDQTQRREQERNEAQTCARMAEERLAVLTSGNERLATEIARLRALFSPGPARAPPIPRPSKRWRRSGTRCGPCSPSRMRSRHDCRRGRVAGHSARFRPEPMRGRVGRTTPWFGKVVLDHLPQADQHVSVLDLELQ